MFKRLFCIYLLTLLLPGCNTQETLNVQVILHQAPYSCNKNQELMFYLSDFTVNGKKVAVTHPSSQHDSLVLMGANCNSAQSWQFTLANLTQGDDVNFSLAVPFALNHLNPLQQQAPLNESEMFWSWQLGHKFLRLDLADYNFHLGSTDCHSASKLRAPKEPCKYPNRFEFSIKNIDLNKPIVFNLDNLLLGTQQKFCMSEQTNTDCQILFGNLAQGHIFYQDAK